MAEPDAANARDLVYGRRQRRHRVRDIEHPRVGTDLLHVARERPENRVRAQQPHDPGDAQPLGDYDLWGQLGGITAPTLVVHGDRDPIPADMARAMADSLVNAEFVLLEEAGHFPFVERPDVLFPSIERFLADLRSEP